MPETNQGTPLELELNVFTTEGMKVNIDRKHYPLCYKSGLLDNAANVQLNKNYILSSYHIYIYMYLFT